MGEQVTVSIQLPAGALGQLAQVLSAARELMEGGGTAAASEGAVASGSFDERRFRELSMEREDPAAPEGTASPQSVPPPETKEIREASPAQAAPGEGEIASAVQEAAPMADPPTAETAQWELGQVEAAAVAAAGAESPLPSPGPREWGAPREALSPPGPAPLTAEAVSQAFRRDDRRYDRGFPLYQ